MAVTQYIGSRYVPIFADPAEWSSTKTYEPLTIVLHQGNSFTSKQFVPVGIDITNTDFWAETGNYNAQIEQYRQSVLNFVETFDDKTPFVTPEMFGAVGDGVTNDTNALKKCSNAGLPVLLTKSYYMVEKIAFNASIQGIGRAELVYAPIEDVGIELASDGLSLNNVKFSCNNVPTYGVFVTAKNASIINCFFKNCNVAIRATHGINVSNCIVNNAETGVYVSDCSEQINISDYVFVNDKNYKIDELMTPGKSGILIERTTSIVNIDNAYIENVLENFVYSQAYKTFVHNSIFVNGLVVKGVGYDDYMQDTCVVENCTFVDTYRRFTGNVLHCQIYTCVNSIWKNIVYIGSISNVFFGIGREATNVLIDGFTGNTQSYPISIGSTSNQIAIKNINITYETIPSAGIAYLNGATIGNLDIIECSYITKANVTNAIDRHVLGNINSTIENVNLQYTTNVVESTFLDYSGSIEATYTSNSLLVLLQNIFALSQAIKDTNVIVKCASVVISGEISNIALYLQDISFVLARYLSLRVSSNTNASIECFNASGKEEYTIANGILTKVSGSTTTITQGTTEQGVSIALRGEQRSTRFDITVLS